MPLQNSQYDAIMRSYAARRAKSRRALEERRARIYHRIPELPALEDSITALQAERVRAAVSGRRDLLESLEQQIGKARQRKLEMLKSHGFSPSDLTPFYICPDCQDTGYRGNQKCHCFLQAEIDLIYQQSHLRQVLEQENFRTFSYSWYQGEELELMKSIVMKSRLFLEAFDHAFQNLLLLGDVGTGKTFLSNCIAKELMDSGHSVVYLTAFELFDQLSQAAFGPAKDTAAYEKGCPHIWDCDLLIIDDLGTELTNSFTTSQLFLCINERILHKKSTLISSNLGIEELRDLYTERITSRIISCYDIWRLPGNDIRMKKKLHINS